MAAVISAVGAPLASRDFPVAVVVDHRALMIWARTFRSVPAGVEGTTSHLAALNRGDVTVIEVNRPDRLTAVPTWGGVRTGAGQGVKGHVLLPG